MNFEQILALLMAKFPSGVRKDVLMNIAMNLAMAAASEDDAKKLVEGITKDKVDAFSKDYRSSIDREVTEANKTYENRLREKYDFKEKGKDVDPVPGSDHTSDTTNPEIAALTKQVSDLTKLMTGFAADKVNTSRRSQIEGLLKDVKDEGYRNTILSGFNYMQFKNDDKFNEYMTSLKADVDKHVQDQADESLLHSGHINFGKTNDHGVSAGVAEYVKDVEARKANGGSSDLGGKSL